MSDITWIKKEAPTIKQAFGCCLNGADFKFDSGTYSSVNKAYNSHILLDDMWLPDSIPYMHMNMILNNTCMYITKIRGFITNLDKNYGINIQDFDGINTELFELIIKSNLFRMYYEQVFNNHINNYVDAYKIACKISYAFTIDFNTTHSVGELHKYEHKKNSQAVYVSYNKKVADKDSKLESILKSYDRLLITDKDLLQSMKDRVRIFNNLLDCMLCVINTDDTGYTQFMIEQMNVKYQKYEFTLQEVLNFNCDIIFIGTNNSDMFSVVNPNDIYVYEE